MNRKQTKAFLLYIISTFLEKEKENKEKFFIEFTVELMHFIKSIPHLDSQEIEECFESAKKQFVIGK